MRRDIVRKQGKGRRQGCARLASALILWALCTVLPETARAGAWPRGPGNHFASATLRAIGDETGMITPSFSYFHEWGLTDRLTFSADLGGAISGFDKMVVGLSLPLPLVDRLGLTAGMNLGVGQVADQRVLRPGLSLGRGLNHPRGWIAADMAAEIFPQTYQIDWKLDLTLGLSPESGHKYYLQLQTGQQQGDPAFTRVEASMAYRLRPGLYLDAGAAPGLVSTDPWRVKLGLWREF